MAEKTIQERINSNMSEISFWLLLILIVMIVSCNNLWEINTSLKILSGDKPSNSKRTIPKNKGAIMCNGNMTKRQLTKWQKRRTRQRAIRKTSHAIRSNESKILRQRDHVLAGV
jgi:hypothetical protein